MPWAGLFDDGDDDDEGDCVIEELGVGRVLDNCEDGDDCEGGLCAEGACTRPCDFGCPFGTECDDDAIPGGLCAPLGEDEEVCR